MNSPLIHLRGISSMATRHVLSELSQTCPVAGISLQFESVGGVDATRRLAAGEPFDLVVLDANALAALAQSGHVLPGSLMELAASATAVAVRCDVAVPDISTPKALRAALLAAEKIGYSSGPSGTALMALFERWSIADDVADRLVKAPAGVPVGKLLAEGSVNIGFQQLSELLGIEGIAILGAMPAGCEIVTTFSGAVGSSCQHVEAAHKALDFLASSFEAQTVKRRHGMA
ncbi:ABC transporter substrate-binding protein [Diaphorobacter sp. HDW4A]|uniref:substrate-binding domain-containing protein n=1 Tax=Diaphorobacter sp. HDW4A TaxID=2714924 RepID=UPI00140BD6FF|nr:substrate-binding domain-containing protein [Diaphorobacter sp. HDW4A]QIL81086.1 ABC transporter substrate-binding protein [Diaphorobacter sp. HDW4A]